ncbi:hypothetical protein ABZP36_035596 [Zizania latifolia]
MQECQLASLAFDAGIAGSLHRRQPSAECGGGDAWPNSPLYAIPMGITTPTPIGPSNSGLNVAANIALWWRQEARVQSSEFRVSDREQTIRPRKPVANCII